METLLAVLLTIAAPFFLIFRSPRICAVLSLLMAVAGGAVLAVLAGDILIMYGLTGVFCITTGILWKLAWAAALISASASCLWLYGRAKHEQGYGLASAKRW